MSYAKVESVFWPPTGKEAHWGVEGMFKKWGQDRDQKQLPPDARMAGTCPACGWCCGCLHHQTSPARTGWGDEQVPAIKCPNPNCGAVVFVLEVK